MLTTTIHTNYYRKWKEKTSYTNLNVTKYKEAIYPPKNQNTYSGSSI